jgi:acyl carrier protein
MSRYDEILRIASDLVRHRADAAKVPAEILPAHRIQEDLGLDSLAVMELASDVENRFGVSIPTASYDDIHTVADLARVVMELEGKANLRD